MIDSLLAHAVKLLTARPHSRTEVFQRLRLLCIKRANAKRSALRAEYSGLDPSAEAEAVVQHLAGMGLLNDAEFAGWHVGQRVSHKARSRAHLLHELRSKGIPPDLATAAMRDGGYDEVEAALKAARRKPRVTLAELRQHLAFKGFSAETTNKVCTRLRQQPEATELR